MPLQYLTSALGRRTHVVLPVAEYESLQEAQAYQQATQDHGELFPHVVLLALLDDQAPLRVFRKYRGLTQAQLGEKTELSKEYISLLEQGKREGTVSAWKRLSRVLNVDLGLLVGAD